MKLIVATAVGNEKITAHTKKYYDPFCCVNILKYLFISKYHFFYSKYKVCFVIY